MNFDTFFASIEQRDLLIPISENIKQITHSPLDNEALFQLPLISIIILALAKSNRKPKISEIGQLIGECIELTFPSYKGSAQHVGWSANLRIRTVKSLSFLEQANLIIINNRKERLNITELGKKVVERAMTWDENLEYYLVSISRSYRNICISRQLDMEM